MGYQAVFKRWELKYLLTQAQKEEILACMQGYMEADRYGLTTIRNLYLDTEDYRMIRRSIEKPVYKEKLRLRSYRQAERDTPVFVELKKKYRGVVYKRRIELPEWQASQWLCQGGECPAAGQIADEICYAVAFYGTLAPRVYLCYDRQAYFCRDGSDFRVTFDDNILCRREDLSLTAPPSGHRLLPQGMVLMELKTGGAIPLWMVRELTRLKLYKTSFSKYGTAYQTMISTGGCNYAGNNVPGCL